ncbi:Protein DOG1-like 3 [Linum grandiflorum]
MLSPSWRSSLEDAFLWIGGWRPSMAFHLLYSKSGLQLETKLHDLIRGLTTADLSDISAAQLRRIDELQRATIRDEKVIAEKMAKVQESVADVADDLRLETLRAIVDVLTPIQAVHFLIAVAELHLRLRDWGKRRDAATPSRPST